jgi:hypothetical protein
MSIKTQNTSQLMIDLSGLIEYKINQRNDLSKKSPRPDRIILIIDREIDILLKIEVYIPLIEQIHARKLVEYRNRYFDMGIKSGIMKERTGRDHPLSYFE